MSGFSLLNFGTVGTPKVGVSASDIVDAYDEVMEKKNNYIAVKLANNNDSKKRASATVIGANAGLLQMIALCGVYALIKAFPKLNNPLLNKFVVKKFDKWINLAKQNNPTASYTRQLMSAFWAKAIASTGIGAALGYGGGVYATLKNTYVNGKISNTKSGAEGSWMSSGLKSIASTKEGAEVIKNSIHKNDDGSVVVNFNGINKNYLITKKELEDASNEYITRTNEEGKVESFDKKFSKGDGDVLAFELAFEKYSNDVESGLVPRDENIPMSIQRITEDGDMLFSDGSVKELYYLLTGKKTDTIDLSNSTDNVDEVYNKIKMARFFEEYSKNPDKFASEIRLREGEKNKLAVRDKNHSIHKLKTDRNYIITKINSKYVTIADSTKTRERIDIPVSKLNSYIASVNYINVQD